MSAAVFSGTVRHRRLRADAPADFTHPLSMLYVELDELPRLLGGRLMRRWPGLVRIRPRDLHGRARDLGGLRRALSATVRAHTGRPAPEGRIGVLTHPRMLGISFNPVSLYYLYDAAGDLDTVVAEVTSTPWRERRSYVLREARAGRRGEPRNAPSPDPPAHRTADGSFTGEHPKAMRVSPFQPMDQRYRWTVSEPGDELTLSIANHRTAEDGVDLAASLQLHREPLTRSALRAFVRRHPAGTLRILALIYGHAVALKARGAAVHSRHPVSREGGA